MNSVRLADELRGLRPRLNRTPLGKQATRSVSDRRRFSGLQLVAGLNRIPYALVLTPEF
jgi:hypothetical protein